jgi:hypothetical protein
MRAQIQLVKISMAEFAGKQNCMVESEKKTRRAMIQIFSASREGVDLV